MVAIKDYVSLKPGTHCVYAWKSSGGRRLIYCQVVSLEGNTVTVKLPMRNQPGHVLLVVPLDRTRFQTLPNRLVGKAKDSYQLKSIKDLPSVVKRAFRSGDVPVPTVISATSAVGVYGGAELMKRYQIITLGYKGGAPMGVLGLAALPGVALSIYALQKVTEIENDPIALMVTRVGLAIGKSYTPEARNQFAIHLTAVNLLFTLGLDLAMSLKHIHRKRCRSRRSLHRSVQGRPSSRPERSRNRNRPRFARWPQGRHNNGPSRLFRPVRGGLHGSGRCLLGGHPPASK